MDLTSLMKNYEPIDEPGGVEEETYRWVTFTLGNEIYGVDVMKVQEVQRMTDIAPVPGAPPFVLGIFNLRGTVVTVLDAEMRFGLAPRPVSETTRIMIIEVDDSVVGVKVDAVSDVAEVPVSKIHASPTVNAQVDQRYIDAVAHHDDALIIIVNTDKLLRADEPGDLF